MSDQRPPSQPPSVPPPTEPTTPRGSEPPTARQRGDALNPSGPTSPTGYDIGEAVEKFSSSFDDGTQNLDDAPTVDYDPRALHSVASQSGEARGFFGHPATHGHPPAAPPSRPTPPPRPPDLDLEMDGDPGGPGAMDRPTPPSGRARRRTSRRTVRIPNDPIARAPSPGPAMRVEITAAIGALPGLSISTAESGASAEPAAAAGLAPTAQLHTEEPHAEELSAEELEPLDSEAETPPTGVRAALRAEAPATSNGDASLHAPLTKTEPLPPQVDDPPPPARVDEAEALAVIKPMRILSIGEASPPPPSSPEDITADVEAVLADPAAALDLEEDRESLSEIEEIEPDRMSDLPEAPRRPPPPPPKARPDPSRVAQLPPPSHATPPPVTLPADPDRPRVKSWWEELFTDDFIRTLDRPLSRHVTREVNFIEESLGVQQGAVILDLACGSGEHAVELASRGYSVVGYDLSLAMLARAADEAQDRNQKINFLQGDMREMAFEEMFDGVYCWSTSFGYFDDERNFSVLQRIHRALRVGGMFLIDMINRDYVAPRSPSLVWFEGDGCVCMDDMHVDFFTSRLRVKRTTMLDDGRSKELDYSIRLYTLHELGKMLHECGFKVVEVTGHPAHPGIFFGSESPRMIVLAEKSG